jgi:rubrerythrin
MTETTTSDAKLISQLNDLLKLDHEAINAYTVAIDRLQNESHADTIRRFRTDHERHIFELTHLVRAHHGVPIELPTVPARAVRPAVQSAGAAGDDVGLLTSIKSNERKSRDKYRAAVLRNVQEDVRAMLQRAADDEARHYGWVTGVLEQLGGSSDTVGVRAQGALEAGRAAASNVVVATERKAKRAADLGKRAMRGYNPLILMGAAVLTIGAGALAAHLLRRR